MAPRVKARKAEGFDREIAALLRLRNAIVIDPDLDTDNAEQALELIDKLVQVVIGLKKAKSDESGELPISTSA